MRAGSTLIGWGMASGVWEALQEGGGRGARLTVDGTLAVSSATEDIGTGTYTVMTQVAAEMLGLPLENVTFKLGDFDPAGVAGRGRVVDRDLCCQWHCVDGGRNPH